MRQKLTQWPPTILRRLLTDEGLQKDEFSGGENSSILGARSHCLGKFSVEGQDRHHDDGVAHRIGNCSGKEIDKFSEFSLTKAKALAVQAPLIKECFANLECKLVDTKLVNSYNFFIFEVVKAQAPVTPKYPKTFHYTGDGVFMISGTHLSRKKLFKPEYL